MTPAAATTAASAVSKVEVLTLQPPQKVDSLSDNEDSDVSGGQGDIQPVGHDYVEEVRYTGEEKYNFEPKASEKRSDQFCSSSVSVHLLPIIVFVFRSEMMMAR